MSSNVRVRLERREPAASGTTLPRLAAVESELSDLQTQVGITGSTVPTSIEYRLADVQAVAAITAPALAIAEGAAEQVQPLQISGKRFAFPIVSSLSQYSYGSVAIQVIGDSTGDDSTDWPWLLAQMIADDYPDWSVQIATFVSGTQKYGVPVVLQTGPDGDRYLDCSTGTHGMAMGIAASPHLSGVIDVRIKMRMSDWTPPSQNTIAGKSAGSPNRGWAVNVMTSGYLSFSYSVDGTTVSAMSVNTATGFSDGSDGWCRWVWTPNDGAGNTTLETYKSTDGYTWVQLGTTTVTPGAVTQYDNSTTPYTCGGTTGSVLPAHVQRIYQIEIRDGIDGPIMAPVLPELWPPIGSTSANAVGARVLTVVNGSVGGASISYLSDATRVKKLLPDYGQEIIFLSCSHNDTVRYGRDYIKDYQAWIQAIETRLPGSTIVALTQNPQTDAATYSNEHAMRRRNIISAAHSMGYGAIDIADVFLQNPSWETQWMVDSAHPNGDGQSEWAAEVYKFITAAES